MTSQESKVHLLRIEGRRTYLLLEREETWNLKSRAIWLDCRDDNTKIFHAYARGRKAANTIWSLKDEQGEANSSFEDKARICVAHFKNIFKAPP